jgi:MFS family permease
MSYEHGSIDLGIKNPFKFEGVTILARGVVVTLLGVIGLFQVASLVKDDRVLGWIMAGIGFFLLATGIKAITSGAFKLFRYFVGRSVPVSLAQNFAKSEVDVARKELRNVFYKGQDLEEMLMGRKNKTFHEPVGWIARLVHTLFPKLTFLPYLMRNLALRVANSVITTGVALLCFGLAWFVSVTGLIGDAGDFIIPLFSMWLMLYLLFTWSGLGAVFSHKMTRLLENTNNLKVAKVIAFSILVPVVLGFIYESVVASSQSNMEWVSTILSFTQENPIVRSGWFVVLTLIGAAVAMTFIALLIRARCRLAKPITEVSELRENWQESVHPREIFINIETIVMANRRYKEVPNRVYRELQPQLKEQSDSKGSFDGEMIIENQPAVQTMNYDAQTQMIRNVATIFAQVLLGIAAIVLFFSHETIAQALNGMSHLTDIKNATNVEQALGFIGQFIQQVSPLIHTLLTVFLLTIFGHLIATTAHIFWAEMWFDSLLVYFRCEGTFTESKLSTGTSIYDSTRSENNVVRSSMTPWIIVSKIRSSIFAESGRDNLEAPRLVLEMNKDDEELDSIVNDMKSFLGDREAIATVNNEKDLAATSNIYQINEQTRVNTEKALDAAKDPQVSHEVLQELGTEERDDK